MLEAHTLNSIVSQLTKELEKPILKQMKLPVINLNHEIFRPFDMQRQEYELVTVSEDRVSKLIGILFCHPQSPIGKEILPHLGYFHKRSGNVVDFLCAGYGADWPPEYKPDQYVVGKIDKTDWLFSDEAFDELRREIEKRTKWEYSGETDMLLLSSRKATSGCASLDFSTAIACNLEAMQRDNAFTSVRSFFEKLFRVGENYTGGDPVWHFSDKMGIHQGAQLLMTLVLKLLPDKVAEFYKSAQHYSVKDISK